MYFVDHNKRTTQFNDPRLNSQILNNILKRQTPPSSSSSGNPPSMPSTSTHNPTISAAAASGPPVTNTAPQAAVAAPLSPRTRINECDLPQGLLNDSELLPKYRRDLVGKLKVLRAELTVLQPQSGHCRLEVSRSEVFEESYR